MAAGLGILKLPPAAFWAMTPRELGAALDGALGLVPRRSPLRRARLRELMRQFPDVAPDPARRGANTAATAGATDNPSVTETRSFPD